MKLNLNIDVYVPSGFYCKRNGDNKCSRMNDNWHKRPYCEVFYPLLDTNSHGDVLKCEQCLMAERKQRAKE